MDLQQSTAAERFSPALHNVSIKTLLDLLKEVSRISSQLDPSVPPEWIVKKAHFLAYELGSFAQPTDDVFQKLKALNEFFFSLKHFRIQGATLLEAQRISGLLLHKVLSERAGSPIPLSLLYSWLANQIGVRLEFVDLQPMCYLRYLHHGVSHYIDLSKNGELLSSDGILERLNEHYLEKGLCDPDLFESICANEFVVRYLTELKSAFRFHGEAEALLMIQSDLIVYQPSNLNLIGERALLYSRLGLLKNALADLKRYFTFTTRDRSPADLVEVYEDLLQQLS